MNKTNYTPDPTQFVKDWLPDYKLKKRWLDMWPKLRGFTGRLDPFEIYYSHSCPVCSETCISNVNAEDSWRVDKATGKRQLIRWPRCHALE